MLSEHMSNIREGSEVHWERASHLGPESGWRAVSLHCSTRKGGGRGVWTGSGGGGS